MNQPELSGLVLTHEGRDPSALLTQLSALCAQVVVVQDTRHGAFDLPCSSDVEDKCRLTVVKRDFDNFPAQRNAGVEQALGAWILLIDSDEKLSDELHSEIASIDPEENTDAFAMPKLEVLKGRALSVSSPCGRIGAFHPRLFRSHLRFAAEPRVHPLFEDQQNLNIEHMTGRIIHSPIETIPELLIKSFRKGRIFTPPEAKGVTPSKQEVIKYLMQFIHHDGGSGAVLAGMQLLFGIGTLLPEK